VTATLPRVINDAVYTAGNVASGALSSAMYILSHVNLCFFNYKKEQQQNAMVSQ